jgi:hypothetical protein
VEYVPLGKKEQKELHAHSEIAAYLTVPLGHEALF